MDRHVPRPTALVVLVLTALVPRAAPAQRPSPSSVAPPARFEDPRRLDALSTAFPEIDRLVREFAERHRVPGVAYGVIVAGRLVHVGTAGFPGATSSSRPRMRR